MNNIAFNTLKFAKKLQNGGFSEQQAIALTEAQNEAFMETTENIIATKTDIYDLKQEFVELRQEMAEFRHEIKQDIANFKQEINAEISQIKSNLKLLNWMFSFMMSGIAALIIKTFF